MRIWILAVVLVFAAGLTEPAQRALSPKTHTQGAGKVRNTKRKAAKTKEKTRLYVAQGPMPSETVALVAPLVAVTYQQGALAITAEDATLREILDKLRESTGAFVQAPVLEQRITVKIAPQAPARAMAVLVDGLQLDYVMLGGTSEHDPLQRIILSPRMAAGGKTIARGTDAKAVQLRSPAPLQIEETDGGESNREGTPASSNETRRSSRH